jgi:hypothetical protein
VGVLFNFEGADLTLRGSYLTLCGSQGLGCFRNIFVFLKARSQLLRLLQGRLFCLFGASLGASWVATGVSWGRAPFHHPQLRGVLFNFVWVLSNFAGALFNSAGVLLNFAWVLFSFAGIKFTFVGLLWPTAKSLDFLEV